MTTKNTARRGPDPIRAQGLTLAWSGVDSRPIRRWRRLFAALLIVLGAAVAAPEARAAVLISNVGQSAEDTTTANRKAQPFRTGAHAAGYTLTSILLGCGSCNSYTTGTVTLHNGTRMGTKVADFTITLDAQNLLATPTTATTLSADTTYVIVTANDFPSFAQWFSNADNALDIGSAAGWTIPAGQEFYHSTTMWTTTMARAHQFRVDGDPITGTTNNAPMVANEIPDQTATAGTDFSYEIPDTTFTDADTGDTLSYTATKADDTNLPTWLTFTASTRTFTGTPAATDVETVVVKVTATDTSSATVSDEFNIVVGAAPMPPMMTGGTTFISNTGQASTSASDTNRTTAFTTGAGTYTLSSVAIRLTTQTSSPTPEVQIYGDTGGKPGTLVATMTNLAPLADNTDNVFTAPANTTLSASTTYWVTTSDSSTDNGTGFRVSVRSNTDLDSGTAAGWSIGNALFRSNKATTWRDAGNRIQFQIRGTEQTTTPTPTNGRPDGRERDPGPDSDGGRAVQLPIPDKHVQRYGHRRHAELRGDERRRDEPADVAGLRRRHADLHGHAGGYGCGDGGSEGDRRRQQRRHGQRRIRHRGERLHRRDTCALRHDGHQRALVRHPDGGDCNSNRHNLFRL